jgi:hypothetical protein
MLLYHATLASNEASIGTGGVSTACSQSAVPSVWGCEASMRHWAVLHCVRRHGGKPEDVVVLEIDTGTSPVHRFRGGLWYSLRTWEPRQIRRVIRFDELSRSPTEEG